MRLGVRIKLFAGFGAVLVLLGIVGIVGFRNTTRFSAEFIDLYENRFQPAIQLANVQLALYELRLGALAYGSADAAGRSAIKADSAKYSKLIDDRMAEYAATYLVPEEVEGLKAWRRAYPGYIEARQRVLALSDDNKLDEANALRNGDAARLFNEARLAATNLIQIQDHIAADMAHETTRDAAFSTMLLIGATLTALLTGLGVAFFLSRSISNGVRSVQVTLTSLAERCATALAGALDAMARNDLTVEVTPATPLIEKYGTDEIGETARMTNLLRDQIVAMVGSYELARAGLRETIGQVQEAARGVSGASEQLGQAAGQTSGVVQQVTLAIQHVAAGAEDTSQSAQASNQAVEQLSQAIDDIAKGSSEQARQVQDVSTTATQMAAGVEQVASRAHSVAAASEQTRASAELGARAVRETVAGMTEIKQVVATAADKVEDLGRLGEKIGAVVETIDDIAEQTNLLALNAAIEAARAGEHGRGFAVVADEVRKLAERSQRETKEIASLIRDVQTGTRDAVSAMEEGSSKVEIGVARADEAGTALAEILRAVEATVDQVTQIATAAQAMATGAHGVVESMSSISAVVEESSASTEEMAAQAGQVTTSIASIAAVSKENSAATVQVSASAEEMSAQVEEMNAQAEELSATAQQLNDLAARFVLDDTAGPAGGVARRRGVDGESGHRGRAPRVARAS